MMWGYEKVSGRSGPQLHWSFLQLPPHLRSPQGSWVSFSVSFLQGPLHFLHFHLLFLPPWFFLPISSCDSAEATIIIFFIFLAVLGLRGCIGFSLDVASQSPSLGVVRGPLIGWLHVSQSAGSIAVASRPSCSTACGIFLDQASDPSLPQWAGGFFPTEPPGKSEATAQRHLSACWWPSEGRWVRARVRGVLAHCCGLNACIPLPRHPFPFTCWNLRPNVMVFEVKPLEVIRHEDRAPSKGFVPL